MPSIRSGEAIKVATWNIRFGTKDQSPDPPNSTDREHPWALRREAIVDQILWEDVDIIGFQEVLDNQLNDLTALLGSAYDHVGVGRDDGKKAGEAVPIFYSRERFELVSVEHFWLTETPDVPGSVSWDMGQTRMATLIHLKLRQPHPVVKTVVSRDMEAGKAHYTDEKHTGEDLFVLNTHYDDRGRRSRGKASELILTKLNSVMHTRMSGKLPLVLVMGDLNSPADEEGYRILTGHRYSSNGKADKETFIDTHHAVALRRKTGDLLLAKPFGTMGTFTDFRARSARTVIDFVMAADNGVVGDGSSARWAVTKFGILSNRVEDGVYSFRASDHCMVTAQFSHVG